MAIAYVAFHGPKISSCHEMICHLDWIVVPPWNRTNWYKKWQCLKDLNLFQTIILGIHVSFRGCIIICAIICIYSIHNKRICKCWIISEFSRILCLRVEEFQKTWYKVFLTFAHLSLHYHRQMSHVSATGSLTMAAMNSQVWHIFCQRRCVYQG